MKTIPGLCAELDQLIEIICWILRFKESKIIQKCVLSQRTAIGEYAGEIIDVRFGEI